MVFLSFSGADRLQGKKVPKNVVRGRRSQEIAVTARVARAVRTRRGWAPGSTRGRGTAAAGRVDGARRARAQIPGGGKGLKVRGGVKHCVRSPVLEYRTAFFSYARPRRGGAGGEDGGVN